MGAPEPGRREDAAARPPFEGRAAAAGGTDGLDTPAAADGAADSGGCEVARRPTRARVLGLPVDAVTMDEAVAIAADAIRGREPCRVVVNNANKAWQATRDERLRRILGEADLVVPEWAMVWASRMLNGPELHHVAGIMLMRRLLADASERGWSVYLVGARSPVVERLAERCRERWPSLELAGYRHGYLTATESAELRYTLRNDPPDLLFVAMGSPRQEYWLAELPDDAAHVSVGVGGSFDVLAGVKRDTPDWARGRGLEWLYRLAQDPRRLWRRYLVTNTWFVGAVLRERLRQRRGARNGR